MEGWNVKLFDDSSVNSLRLRCLRKNTLESRCLSESSRRNLYEKIKSKQGDKNYMHC